MSERCQNSEVWLTRDEDANAFGDFFRSEVSSFPAVGGIIAGLVPDTLTANAIRSCPGATIDHTSGYALDLLLIGFIVLLIVIYLFVK